MGVLADMFPKKYVMLVIYALVAATVPLLYLAPSLGTLRLAAIAFGVGLGGDYMIIPLMAAELYGLARLGRVMGVVLTADGVAEALVPMGVGALRDHYGIATAPASACSSGSPCLAPSPSRPCRARSARPPRPGPNPATRRLSTLQLRTAAAAPASPTGASCGLPTSRRSRSASPLS